MTDSQRLPPGLRILIADDHAIVRRGLRDILREAAPTTFVGEAANGVEALQRVAAEHWDVVVLDITMPLKTGLEVLRQLHADRPELPVLMLSMHSGAQYVTNSLKAGARAYLHKETAPDQLIKAILTVLRGGRYTTNPVD